MEDISLIKIWDGLFVARDNRIGFPVGYRGDQNNTQPLSSSAIPTFESQSASKLEKRKIQKKRGAY